MNIVHILNSNMVFILSTTCVLLVFLVIHIAEYMIFYRQAAFGKYVDERLKAYESFARKLAREHAKLDKAHGTRRHENFANDCNYHTFWKEVCHLDRFHESDFEKR